MSKAIEKLVDEAKMTLVLRGFTQQNQSRWTELIRRQILRPMCAVVFKYCLQSLSEIEWLKK